jgi:hypothetical protein
MSAAKGRDLLRLAGGRAQMLELAPQIVQHRFKRRIRRPGETTPGMQSG